MPHPGTACGNRAQLTIRISQNTVHASPVTETQRKYRSTHSLSVGARELRRQGFVDCRSRARRRQGGKARPLPAPRASPRSPCQAWTLALECEVPGKVSLAFSFAPLATHTAPIWPLSGPLAVSRVSAWRLPFGNSRGFSSLRGLPHLKPITLRHCHSGMQPVARLLPQAVPATPLRDFPRRTCLSFPLPPFVAGYTG